MPELIDVTKPIWMKNGTPVTDLTVYEGSNEWPLFSKQLGMSWMKNGINSIDQLTETDDDLTNIQPAGVASQSEPLPTTTITVAELAALRQENEHLKQEVIRMHAEYRTLWDMTRKIQGRRETSR